MPDLPVAAPDPAARLTEWADDAENLVQSVRYHEPYPNPAALRRDVRALLAERQQDKERIERLEAIENAAQEYVDAERQNDAALARLLNEADPDGTKTKVQALTRANADAAFVALDAALAVEEDARDA